MNDPLPHITLDKELRRDIDAIIQRLKDGMLKPEPNGPGTKPRWTIEREQSRLKLTEAVMWLGMDLKAINDANPGAIDNPYPSSKDPSTGAKIEPTADGLKL